MRKTPLTDEQVQELLETVSGLQQTVANLQDQVSLLTANAQNEHDANDEFPGWNGYHRSADVEAVVGVETYARFWPESFLGDISSNDELHLATLVEMTSLAGEYALPEALAAFARDWLDSIRMIRTRLVRSATIRLDLHYGGAPAGVFVTLEADQIVNTLLCTCSEKCGSVLANPLVYWKSDCGGLSNALIEDVEDDMVDLEALSEGVRLTGIHLAAQRVQDLRPAGVVDLHAARLHRTASRM